MPLARAIPCRSLERAARHAGARARLAGDAMVPGTCLFVRIRRCTAECDQQFGDLPTGGLA
eukprot:10287784-Alexandrium_andersonii.AAC.1